MDLERLENSTGFPWVSLSFHGFLWFSEYNCCSLKNESGFDGRWLWYRPWWTGTASAVNVGPSMSLGSVEGTGVDDYRGFYGGFMRFPSMGDLQNGWFIMENHNLNGHSHYNNYNPIGECQLQDANILQSSIFPRCSDICVSDTDRSDSDTILG